MEDTVQLQMAAVSEAQALKEKYIFTHCSIFCILLILEGKFFFSSKCLEGPNILRYKVKYADLFERCYRDCMKLFKEIALDEGFNSHLVIKFSQALLALSNTLFFALFLQFHPGNVQVLFLTNRF